MLGALCFVGMAGSLATDLYLPAFPSLQEDLGASAAVVQLTLTAFLVGAAFGQFTVGTISDALGRRRTLLVAMALYALAGFASAAMPTIELVIAMRVVQGLFGALGAALARAIVADLASGDRAARGISAVIAAMGLGPVFGSPVGALLAEWGGWRLTLAGLAAIATAMTVVTALAIPESLPPEKRHPARMGPLVGNLASLARDGSFLGYVLSYAFTYGAFITYIGSSSFVVQNVFGQSPVTYSLVFALGSLCFVGGAMANGRLVRVAGPAAMLRAAQILAFAAAGSLVVLAVSGALTIWLWVPLSCLFSAGIAASMSDSTALALKRAAFAAGSGSAALGLFQYTVGAFASPVGGLWGDDTALPATIAMTVGVALALLAATVGRALERRAA